MVVFYILQSTGHSLSLHVAAVVGGLAGVLVIGGTALFIACFCHYQRKHKSNI